MPLHNLGMLLRTMNQSTVDLEDLYKIMQIKSNVQEKKDAVDFELGNG